MNYGTRQKSKTLNTNRLLDCATGDAPSGQNSTLDPSQTSKPNGRANQSPEASTVPRSMNGNGVTMPDTEFSDIPLGGASGDLPGGQHSTVDLSQNASNEEYRPGPSSRYSYNSSNDESASAQRNSPSKSIRRTSDSSKNLESETGSVKKAEGAILALNGTHDSRGAVWRYIKIMHHGTAEQRKSQSLPMLLVALLLFGFFAALAIANISSARIASDRVGLSSSQHCGLWEFDTGAGDEPARRDDRHNYQKETQASQYARTCYIAPDLTSTLSCGFFYNQSIAFGTKIGQRCPFESQELCFDGLYSAVTFDTGPVDASIIGINAPLTHKFRRKTTCSPLNMSEPYITRSDRPTNDTYLYNYGPKNRGSTNHTFQTHGHPFDWLVPVYSVKYAPIPSNAHCILPHHSQVLMSSSTYISSLDPSKDYWTPIPSLRPPLNSTITIIFVSSMHIYHSKSTFDPIFHATEPRYFEDLREPYFYNSDPRATALACVDTTELCSPDGKICWPTNAALPPDISASPALWLTNLSLIHSNTYDSLKWRLGTALLAQEKVSQSVSRPLSDHHWQLEASHLFATSLARIQYDAWAIATGRDRERIGYVNTTNNYMPEAQGHLCGLYKFKTSDYTNINLVAFVGLIVLAFVIFVLSWNASFIGLGAADKEKDEGVSGGASEGPSEGPSGGVPKGESKGKSKGVSEESSEGVLVIEVLVRFIGSGIVFSCQWLYRCVKDRKKSRADPPSSSGAEREV